MKALSLWQPWATLWVSGSKQIETRGWSTKYRGPLAVHAAKKWNKDLRAGCFEEPFLEELMKVLDSIDAMPLGCIVGIVNLSDCLPTEQLAKTISPQEREFGNYGAGRFGLVANKFKLFKHPIPYKGEQGFFEVPDELLRSAHAA